MNFNHRFILLFIFFLSHFYYLIAEIPSIIWYKSFGGYYDQEAKSIQQTANGGYVVAGYTKPSGSNAQQDILILNIDSEGNEIWSQTYGGEGIQYANSIQQTSDGGYIIAGGTYSFDNNSYDVLIFKTDSEGNEIWTQTFGGDEREIAYSILQTVDDCYIVAGFTESFGLGSQDIWLIKIDAYGNEIWNNTYGTELSDEAYSINQTDEQCYIIAGMSDWNFCLLKIDSNGDEVFFESYDNSESGKARSVQQTTDGGYILAGDITWEDNYCFYSDIGIVKTDSEGNEIWNQYHYNDSYRFICAVHQTMDDGYLLSGCSNDNIYITKFTSLGDPIWSQTYHEESNDFVFAFQETSDDGFIAAGYTYSLDTGSRDVLVAKFSSTNNAIEQTTISKIKSYPNPFNSKSTITFSIPENAKVEISIFNIKGQKINTLINSNLDNGFHSIEWDGEDGRGENVVSGIYFYQLKLNKKVESINKCILLK